MRLCFDAFKQLALLVDDPPKAVLLALDPHEDFLHLPAPSARSNRRNLPFPDLRCKQRAKPLSPEPHGFVTDLDPLVVQQIHDVAVRRREPGVHHDRDADDF